MRGDAEVWRDYRLLRNRCRCRLAGPFCLTEYDAEKDGEQCGGQNATLLDAVGDGKAARQRSIELHLTLLTFMELAEDGEKFWGTAKARQDFPIRHG